MDKETELKKFIIDSSLKKLLSFVAAAIASFILQMSLFGDLESFISIVSTIPNHILKLALLIALTIITGLPWVGSIVFMSGVTAEMITIAHFGKALELNKLTEDVNYGRFSRIYRYFAPSGMESHLTGLTKIGIIVIASVSIIVFVTTESQILSRILKLLTLIFR